MSLHRLTAGSGYDYLTRQVAAMDSSEKGHVGLASYYTQKGETPGRWTGSGMAGIDGLNAGDLVTAEQMQALFGAGLHPLAAQRAATLQGPGLTERDLRGVTRLGEPFKVYNPDISPFRIEVAHRLEALNRARGLPRNASSSIGDRARIRCQVALELFTKEYGRQPLDARELAGYVARLSRPNITAVAGFDLTFSPVKSVSTLWALADPHLAAQIERAHHAAVADALRFIETHALFTRTGRGGVQQVDVRGLVAVAFIHRDSRAGDPDLHTHVAVANKVQTLTDGRWLSIDSRVLHKAVVAASETYNTSLERRISETLGVRFAERPGGDARKRPVREIIGLDPRLNDRWSSRRKSIDVRRKELVRRFQRDHHRPPTPVESIDIAEQATLETRETKHEPLTLAEQRATWRDQAREVLGGDTEIGAMILRVLHPTPAPRTRVDQDWVGATARQIVKRTEADRATWQDWHLRGEALRQVRAAGVPLDQVDHMVDRLVASAIGRHSIPITRPIDTLAEPQPLRRIDGASVYTVARSQLYTSQRVLDAEARLVTAAGQQGGIAADTAAIDVALLESEANGLHLNPGQVQLVRDMASSGARLQLAIAPAGSGKTTAMHALATAWANAGGHVIGLAPSAAAAAQLADQTGTRTDTLAKLVHHLGHSGMPDWLAQIGPKHLVIIDEAGMADTVSLDQAVTHILARGGNVRLIGDDQQLAAIGAGGVLRDIQHTHGALHLTELIRFADPAEGSASLALRDGRTEALGFYLDNGRVHVGDEATMADDLFDAWTADFTAGRDSIMLAHTRERVAELNQRAQTQRLACHTPRGVIDLADGNQASDGDLIITRENDRRLRVSASDWVKNGDRWIATSVHPKKGIRARHVTSGRYVTLPPDYVAESVELGYASTIHTAQGITADTMHGLLVGDETRQLAYTMLTRGRHANHAYLSIVTDGDPHTAIRPETVNPLTPTDILEAILARDEAAVSATTQLRQSHDPAPQLRDAVARYTDAIAVAATELAGDVGVRGLERRVEAALPRLSDAPGWPALCAELLMVEADGGDPIQALARACADPINTAHDPASILAWRVADNEWHTRRGPLPWLAGIPAQLAEHPTWGPYLADRARLIVDLSGQVRGQAGAATPAWVASVATVPPASLVADVEVWRGATGVEPADLRPTGDRQHPEAAARTQRQLDKRLQTSQNAALDEWGHALAAITPTLLQDRFAPVFARRLAQLSSAGIPARRLLDQAAATRPLPDDHAAAALWWRISRHVTPAVASHADDRHHLATEWLDRLTTAVGVERSRELQASPWWPCLVATIERGLQRGWNLGKLLEDAQKLASDDGHLDRCQAWVWRLSLLTYPVPAIDLGDASELDEPPADLWDGWRPTDLIAVAADDTDLIPIDNTETPGEEIESVDLDVDAALAMEAVIRDGLGVPEPTDADIRRMMDRADMIRTSPVTPERIAEINALAAHYYERCYPDSWARGYLIERLRQDITGDPWIRPGYAPDGWTGLVDHLRRKGVTDTELLTAGLATTASTGRLIDRFRDRVVFPITHQGQILGFVGRRNPKWTDDEHGPKYLNTPDTPLYHKGAQLYAAADRDVDATPVLVEGPMDAIAVTLAGSGTHVGLAPLGTSLTDEQAAQLHALGREPIIATDGDAAGRAAAERDYWLLTPYGTEPRYALLPDCTDPAELITSGNSDRLVAAIEAARPLAEPLIDERISGPPQADGVLDAIRVLAARSPARWSAGVEHIAEQSGLPSPLLQSALLALVRAWNTDPKRAVQQAHIQVTGARVNMVTTDMGGAAAGLGEVVPMRARPSQSTHEAPRLTASPTRPVGP